MISKIEESGISEKISKKSCKRKEERLEFPQGYRCMGFITAFRVLRLLFDFAPADIKCSLQLFQYEGLYGNGFYGTG